MAERVEGADALQLVAEQVEAKRPLAAARKNVDDAAAHGVLARLHHGAAAPVAVAGQGREQPGTIDALAGAGGEQAGAQRLGRRHLLHQGIDGGDDQARLLLAGLEQPGERIEPLRAMMSPFGDTRS